jgi:hypothetical protein
LSNVKLFKDAPHFIPEDGSADVFQQRSAYPGRPLRTSYSQSLGTREAGNLLRYAIENKSSPRAVIEKWVSKN